MDKYVTGAVIRKLRENKKMTQEELAEKVFVSGKAVLLMLLSILLKQPTAAFVTWRVWLTH